MNKSKKISIIVSIIVFLLVPITAIVFINKDKIVQYRSKASETPSAQCNLDFEVIEDPAPTSQPTSVPTQPAIVCNKVCLVNSDCSDPINKLVCVDIEVAGPKHCRNEICPGEESCQCTYCSSPNTCVSRENCQSIYALPCQNSNLVCCIPTATPAPTEIPAATETPVPENITNIARPDGKSSNLNSNPSLPTE